LDPLWETVVAAWSDEAAHQHFLDTAAQVDALDVAAARYRERRQADPNDAQAQSGLERAVRLAQTMYEMRARAERPARPPVALRVGGTVGAGLVLLATVWMLWRAFAGH
jgi:hypothetical protein